MMPPLMQVPQPSFWSAPNGSTELWIKIVVALILGILAIFGLMARSAYTWLRRAWEGS